MMFALANYAFLFLLQFLMVIIGHFVQLKLVRVVGVKGIVSEAAPLYFLFKNVILMLLWLWPVRASLLRVPLFFYQLLKEILHTKHLHRRG